MPYKQPWDNQEESQIGTKEWVIVQILDAIVVKRAEENILDFTTLTVFIKAKEY